MKSFFVALIVVVAAVPAAAENKIVLESYTGGKTEAAGKQLEPLLQALSSKGFVAGYEAVGRGYESRVSAPAIADGLPADFAAKVDKAQDAFVSGRFEEAAKALAPLIDTAKRNSAAFVNNKSARDTFEKALIVLALSQERQADLIVSQQTFAELIRTFPDKTVQRGLYGADAALAFEKAKKALAAFGRGKLVVKSSVDTGAIYINETFTQIGSVTMNDAAPGDYRVFLQLSGGRFSRMHRVTVRANETAVLNIDAELDAVIQTSPNWTGLAFANTADREKQEIDRAAQFATAVDADAVMVIGIDRVRGKSAIVGMLVNHRNRTEIRSASVPIDSVPSAELLQSLALFVIGELASPPPGVYVNAIAPRPSSGITGPIDQPSTGGGAWGGWKWITGVAGVAALGVGGYLVATDGKCKTDPPPGVTCPDVYNNAVPGYLALGGGAVLTGLSIYLFVKSGGSSSSSRTAYIVPTNGGGFAGFSARF